jgi:ppGpp synthetase/RelA/SpoT-type nucleotidyltranferase
MTVKQGCACDLGELMLHLADLFNTAQELEHFEQIVGNLRPEDKYQMWGSDIEMAEQDLVELENECDVSSGSAGHVTKSIKEQRELLNKLEKTFDRYEYKEAASIAEDLIMNLRMATFTPK